MIDCKFKMRDKRVANQTTHKLKMIHNKLLFPDQSVYIMESKQKIFLN